MSDLIAAWIQITGEVSDIAVREELRDRANGLGLRGWIRLMDDPTLSLHTEGESNAIQRLITSLEKDPRIESVRQEPVKVEKHEQFAIRGIPAGLFVVHEHQAGTHHFDLRLEVGGVTRSWTVPKGPSLNPSDKRFAVEADNHDLADDGFEGTTPDGAAIVWDRGPYEQGGRVAWPEAVERGHAVFVLHGEKLKGGFALQRTRRGAQIQWLLIKRRDERAQPGSDIVAERPRSVESGRTLDELLGRPTVDRASQTQ